MVQGLVLTPMRARVALDKNVFWCLSSVFKRPHHVRGVVVGFLRRMLRDCPVLLRDDPLLSDCSLERSRRNDPI